MISRVFALGLVAALAGCSQADGREDAAAEVAEANLSAGAPVLLGKMGSGESRDGYVTYPGEPRAWAFGAKGGDTITIDVRSSVGDAVAFLTDASYNVLKYNDDAGPLTRDARIVYRIPDDVEYGEFRIVFANYREVAAPFDVELAIELGATCSYGGVLHPVGQPFPAQDSCNTCSCGPMGIECTKEICACSPGKEPDKVYMYSPEQCLTVHVSCPAGLQPFSNECGCGCRRP